MIVKIFILDFSKKKLEPISKQTGITTWELAKIKANFPNKKISNLFGNKIHIGDSFWHLHSLNEIFVEKTYNFTSKSNKPLIIDCGANIGLSAIYFKKLYPDAMLVAFEPDYAIYKKLTENLKTFGFTDVNCYNKAVWHTNTLLNFDQDNALGGKINLTEPTSNSIKVQAIKLADFINKRVDFLKIDIEGAEFEVIKSIEDNLHFVESLFIEYHSDPEEAQQLPELLSILKNAGFRLYIKEAWNNLPMPFLHFNYKPFWDVQLNIFAYRK